MTEIEKLSVSLTKHGAHKVARLIEHFEVDEVLDNTWDTYDGIRIDRAQVAKILSALRDGTLPGVWNEAKKQGPEAIKALVLLAIVFSHSELISVFQTGVRSRNKGSIKRGQLTTAKSFTNLKNNFVELGYSDTADEEQFSYDFSPITNASHLAPIVVELIRLKLIAAKWAGTNDIIDECVALNFHRVLALSEADFRSWLTNAPVTGRDEDELPNKVDPPTEIVKAFEFKAGHFNRSTDDVVRIGSGKHPKARLLHNALQNALYAYLSGNYGEKNIGTEVPTGASDTSIDLVRRHGNDFIFYEIKTAVSLKKALREALPQLLEYAYWPSTKRAVQLIVVTPNKSTSEAREYLKLLRDTFNIPIFHETIDAVTGALSDRI
jgi:hypothetical protein